MLTMIGSNKIASESSFVTTHQLRSRNV